MGVWSTSLYGGDFAMDLRSTVAAVVRLPFEPERLVEILTETEPSAANNPRDPGYTAFWLVVADQFAKRGIPCDRPRDTALRILAESLDESAMADLGMKAGDLLKRQRMLNQLKERLTVIPPSPPKPRKVIRNPQPLLMSPGDILVYPTCYGKAINPCFSSKDKDWVYRERQRLRWTQTGWAAIAIVDCGRAFGFLAWYRALTVAESTAEKPSLNTLLLPEVLWRFQLPGTCSATHFKKLELEKLGVLPVDPEAVRRFFPQLRPGISAAVSNISIANSMNAAPSVPPHAIPEPGIQTPGRAPTIRGIRQLLYAA